jgi:hypothetical protein
MSVVASDCGYFLSVTCTGMVDQPPPRCPTTCSRDDECDSDAHCDAVCLPDLPDGDVCDENGDCISGHCDDNVCCSSGDCCRTPADCEASYSSPAVCDIPSACQGSRDAAICTGFRCGTAMDVDDDSGCTASVEALTCGLYPSRFCTGGSDQPAPMCAMSCTSDGECDDAAHCDAPMCLTDLPDGSACDENSDCISAHCQNGFCCASGDCCSRGSDCSVADYGEPSRCLSATTCQGERRDPVCNATFQCQTGPVVGDDSGCSGLLASDCGLYPGVFCTAMMSQPPDPASRCAMTCAVDGDCDPGAFCMGGMCRPRGMVGDACTSTAECGSGLSCVDGVCCTSSCTGTCMACNVAGSLGTCTPVPGGTDPAAECGMLSCLGYYTGWAGDRCFHRADAPASAVFCDGGGACQTAATICPTTGFGTLQVDCNDQCQTRNLSTCTGMTAGVCNNDPPGSQTCGTGACQRTTAECNMGTPVMCMPGTPTAETCNDIDDNCNGPVDEGLSGDGYEPNNSCGEATSLGRIYTQAASGRSTSVTVTPTIYGTGDIDVFRVDWSENDSTCGCGVSTDEDYGLTATLTVPAGAGSYRVCGHMSGTCATGTTCVTVLAGDTAAITIWKDGCCSPFGCNDDGTGWFTVNGVGAPAVECRTYTLDVQTVIGCR